METLVSTRERTFNVNCNWKAFLEVFNEYYHLPYVHPKIIYSNFPEDGVYFQFEDFEITFEINSYQIYGLVLMFLIQLDIWILNLLLGTL